MNSKVVKVELGCGNNKRIKDSIGVDVLSFPGVDYVFDLNKGMPFFEANSIDEIYSHHFLEHLDDLPFFMGEVNRVLKRGGTLRGEVPHFSNPYFYSDPTHKNHFGLYTLNYFVKNQESFVRKVPSFYNDLNFEIVSYTIVFKSKSLSTVYSRIKNRILNRWFNSSLKRLEVYEELFCYRFPCYELKFCIRKP
ncbi:class I SAM-dependent methyltransferase [Algoriphagus yeomjeoni]|uniref:class I SAM-dependent methyltransferase n=1 Tax=Algoriphagus yeomjeoni TaxID=291403 RepID=UPI003CE586D0